MVVTLSEQALLKAQQAASVCTPLYADASACQRPVTSAGQPFKASRRRLPPCPANALPGLHTKAARPETVGTLRTLPTCRGRPAGRPRRPRLCSARPAALAGVPARVRARSCARFHGPGPQRRRGGGRRGGGHRGRMRKRYRYGRGAGGHGAGRLQRRRRLQVRAQRGSRGHQRNRHVRRHQCARRRLHLRHAGRRL